MQMYIDKCSTSPDSHAGPEFVNCDEPQEGPALVMYIQHIYISPEPFLRHKMEKTEKRRLVSLLSFSLLISQM